ncbi:MAG: arginine--tRNA ligase [Flavobacteriaceae bacterium]|nr:arginine--tRNA ligase [Flavobacteriaceae bacterium]
MNLQQLLSESVIDFLESTFKASVPEIEIQPTRKDFEGDATIVVFSLLRYVKTNPVALATQIGEYLVETHDEIERFNVVKGFLNLVIADSYYIDFFNSIQQQADYGCSSVTAESPYTMVEFSSPNTNKPLHLGHVRNILLGSSMTHILEASGQRVLSTQIINDRGIHICKSMLAWKLFGDGETPDSSGIKGDTLVGKYYVAFDKEYKKQVNALVEKGIEEVIAKKEAPILLQAQQMLVQWEQDDQEVRSLWSMMNQWVYDGFSKTYDRMGVDFDSYYYESDTYILGKVVVQSGLDSGVFFKKEDGSVWIDLSDDGLDEKIVLRADGTSVYITQDIGTALQRVNDNPEITGMVYTVGNEQDYHFKVLFLILKKLGYSWADHLYHLSYGMVDLPSGKMKSREGTVVDADALMTEMVETAQSISVELGKLEGFSNAQKQSLYETIGLGALKYFILKVDPKKRILFDPKESVDFNGNTGPFIQYTYARIQSILRKSTFDIHEKIAVKTLHAKEKELIKILESYPEIIQTSAQQFSPAIVANYTYELVKNFNSFYQNITILGEEDVATKQFRIQLSHKVATVIKSAMGLLGIEVPIRM